MQAQPEICRQMQETDSRHSSHALSAEKAEIWGADNTSAQEPNSDNVDKGKRDGQMEPENPSQELGEQQPPQRPFSIFSPSERRFIIMIASLAAVFSPLSANIYFPALNTLSEDLHVSASKINLTITTYLV